MASTIKDEFSNAEFNGDALPPAAVFQLLGCYGILYSAHSLLKDSGSGS